MKKIFSFLSLTLFLNGISIAQETFPVNGVYNKNHLVYAFTNVKIIVDPETTIEKGNLLIKDGLIIALGEKVEIPKGAVNMI